MIWQNPKPKTLNPKRKFKELKQYLFRHNNWISILFQEFNIKEIKEEERIRNDDKAEWVKEIIPPTKSLVVSPLQEIRIAGGIREEYDKLGILLSRAIDMLQ